MTPFGKDHDGVEWFDIIKADWALFYANSEREEIRDLRAWLEDEAHPDRVRDVSNLLIDLFDRIAAWDGRGAVVAGEEEKVEESGGEEKENGDGETEHLLGKHGVDDDLIQQGLQRVMLCDSLRSLSTVMEVLLEFDRDEQRKVQSAALAVKRVDTAETCRENLEEVNKELKDCKKKQM